MNPTVLIIILFVSLLLTSFVWATLYLRKQTIKDRNTLEELKKKANTVSTKEEIESFHKEFVEKATKINNPHIQPELHRINGYLQGLYKKFKN